MMKYYRFHLSFILLIFIANIAQAQSKIVIKAGKVIDPKTGLTFTNQYIFIENGIIDSISIKLSSSFAGELIDLSDYTVLPGLMDVHTHLCAKVNPAAETLGMDFMDLVLVYSDASRALLGAKYAKEMLESGFTTVRDAGNAGNYINVDLKQAIGSGIIDGPSMKVAGRIIAPFGGQFVLKADKKHLDTDEYIFADTQDELKKAIRENIYYGSDVIKIIVDGQKYQYTTDDIKYIVKEASVSGIKVMAHCQTAKGAFSAAEAGVHSIEHGFRLTDSILTVIKNKKITLVNTPFTVKILQGFGRDSAGAVKFHKRMVENLKLTYAKGVLMAFGTDIMVDVGKETRGNLAIEYLDSYVKAGIPNKEILKILITNAANLLELEKKCGEVKPGMYADLIATKDNPAENIQTLKQVAFVMKRGKVIKKP